MKYKVFVDGAEGTTGLKIHERLERQPDIEVLNIGTELRKDADERAKLINSADIVFLCLPDAASREAVQLVTNPKTKVIDSSTAFRTSPEWAYGFPELGPDFREKIKNSKRVAVPGCHATGFISLAYPLVKGGIISPDYPLTCHSISGYSGGGKKLIAKYETDRNDKDGLKSPNYYALALSHKHLPEMQKICGLSNPPLFSPVVADYKQGMLVTVPLFTRLLNKKLNAADIYEFFADYYKDEKFIDVMPACGESCLKDGFLNACECNGTNSLQIFIFYNNGQILLASRLDNLGKGASGAAVQCMNIMLGQDESTGLDKVNSNKAF